SVISGNSALTAGGGLLLYGVDHQATNAVIINTTVASNQASFGGGISVVRSLSGDVSLAAFSATVSDNTCTTGAGGLSVANYDTVTLANTIGGPNYLGTSKKTRALDDCIGPVPSLDFNLFPSTAGCTITGAVVNSYSGVGPNLGPLQDNGGPTPTMA